MDLHPFSTDVNRLVAIMLGQLQMSVEECIKHFSNLLKQVDPTGEVSWPPKISKKAKKPYSGKKLKNAIESIIKDYKEDYDFDNDNFKITANKNKRCNVSVILEVMIIWAKY